MRSWGWASGMVLTVLIGCGGAAANAPASEGAGTWRKLVTRHFVLATDFPDAEARTEIEALEQGLSAFLTIFPDWPDPPRPEVLSFSRAEDYRRFGGSKLPDFSQGVFESRSTELGDQRIIAIVGSSRESLLHELFHRLLHDHLPKAPVWLNEGLAQYYSTMEVKGDRLVIGAPGWGRVWAITVEALAAASQADFYGERFSSYYQTAWALAFLLNDPDRGYHDRFQKYLAALGRGTDAWTAWSASFAGVAASRMQTDVDDLLRHRMGHAQELPYHGGPPAAAVAMDLSADDRRFIEGDLPESASRAGPTCPAEGGASWHELTTDHFLYDTDLPLEAARQDAMALELIRGGIAAALGQAPEDARTHVIDFARISDFRVLRPTFAFGDIHLAGESGPGIVVGQSTPERLAFLLALRRLHARRPAGPAWLTNGLAGYEATVELKADGLTIGRLGPTGLVHSIRAVLAAKARDFVGPDGDGYRKASLVLVHFLRARHPVGLEKYIAAIDSGAHADAAWRAAFGDLSIDDLQKEHDAYAGVAHPATTVRARIVAPPEPIVRELADAEVHLVWIVAGSWNKARYDAIARDLAEARRQSPGSARVHLYAALLLERQDHLAESRAETEEAVRLGADPADVFLNSAFMKSASDDTVPLEIRRDELRRLEPLAKEPVDLNNLAWACAHVELNDDGLALVRRALALQPIAPATLDTLALLLFQKGDAKGAVDAEERALAVTNDADPRSSYTDALKTYRAAAAAPKRAP